MDIVVWKRLFVVAILVTAAVWYVGDPEQAIFGVLGFFLWGYWSISSFEVVTYTRCCARTEAYPGLAWLGAAAGVLCLLPAVNLLMLAMGEDSLSDRVADLPGFGGDMR